MSGSSLEGKLALKKPNNEAKVAPNPLRYGFVAN